MEKRAWPHAFPLRDSSALTLDTQERVNLISIVQKPLCRAIIPSELRRYFYMVLNLKPRNSFSSCWTKISLLLHHTWYMTILLAENCHRAIVLDEHLPFGVPANYDRRLKRETASKRKRAFATMDIATVGALKTASSANEYARVAR